MVGEDVHMYLWMWKVLNIEGQLRPKAIELVYKIILQNKINLIIDFHIYNISRLIEK